MQHGRTEDQVRDVQAVHDEIADYVVLRETEDRTLRSDLLLFLHDLVVRLGKLLFQAVADLGMQAQLLRIVVQIEHTTHIVALSLKRVHLQAHLIIQFVQDARHQEAQNERSKHEQDAGGIRHQIEYTRREQDRECLHDAVAHLEEAVNGTLRLRNGEHEIVVILGVIVAGQIELRRLLEHLLLQRTIQFRFAPVAPSVDEETVRHDL